MGHPVKEVSQGKEEGLDHLVKLAVLEKLGNVDLQDHLENQDLQDLVEKQVHRVLVAQLVKLAQEVNLVQ